MEIVEFLMAMNVMGITPAFQAQVGAPALGLARQARATRPLVAHVHAPMIAPMRGLAVFRQVMSQAISLMVIAIDQGAPIVHLVQQVPAVLN